MRTTSRRRDCHHCLHSPSFKIHLAISLWVAECSPRIQTKCWLSGTRKWTLHPSRVHQNCIYLWTETHCDDTNICITRKRTERVRSFVRSTTNVCCLPACLPAPPSTPNSRNATCTTTTTNTLSLPRHALSAAAAAAERRRRLMSNKPPPEKEKRNTHTLSICLCLCVSQKKQSNKQY